MASSSSHRYYTGDIYLTFQPYAKQLASGRVAPSVPGYWNIDLKLCLLFQATIIQMVMDDSSQQTPSDIWYSCQHVSVLLLCSGKPHNPTHACQISHSAQFRALMQFVFIKHTHPHIQINAHPHKHSGIHNGLIVIRAIVLPFSHASQTTVKTHSNTWCLNIESWSAALSPPKKSKYHSYFKINKFNWLLDQIFTHKEPVYCVVVVPQRTVSLLVQYHFSPRNCKSWSPGTSPIASFPEKLSQ